LLKLFGRTVQGFDFARGAGCEKCNKTGYHGRIGLFELFVVDDEIQNLIQLEKSLNEIQRLATAKGMKPLTRDGLLKVERQITTLEEIVRTVPFRQIVAYVRDNSAPAA